MPKVSVIVPFYNVEPYIERCSRSLFGQTLNDIEFIFVDDCSTDKSVKVLQQTLSDYPSRLSQTRIISLDTNGGQAKALCAGLKHATGDFVIKCDGDDEVDIDTYELMYNKAIQEDLDLVICDFVQLYPDGSSVYMGQHLKEDMIFEMLTNKISTSVCTKLVRREVFKEPFVYPTGSMCEDFVFSIQYFYRCSKVGTINRDFYKYYRYPTSFLAVSDESRYRDKFFQLVDNMKLVFGIIADNNDRDRYEDQILYQKLSAKNFLLKYIDKKPFYRLWKETFREINGKVLFSSAISRRDKLMYVLTLFHLYPVYTKLKQLKNRK